MKDTRNIYKLLIIFLVMVNFLKKIFSLFNKDNSKVLTEEQAYKLFEANEELFKNLKIVDDLIRNEQSGISKFKADFDGKQAANFASKNSVIVKQIKKNVKVTKKAQLDKLDYMLNDLHEFMVLLSECRNKIASGNDILDLEVNTAVLLLDELNNLKVNEEKLFNLFEQLSDSLNDYPNNSESLKTSLNEFNESLIKSLKVFLHDVKKFQEIKKNLDSLIKVIEDKLENKTYSKKMFLNGEYKDYYYNTAFNESELKDKVPLLVLHNPNMLDAESSESRGLSTLELHEDNTTFGIHSNCFYNGKNIHLIPSGNAENFLKWLDKVA